MEAGMLLEQFLNPFPAPTLFSGSSHLIPRLSPPHSSPIAHAHSQSPGGHLAHSHFIHKHLLSVRGPTSFPGIPVFPSLVEFSSKLKMPAPTGERGANREQCAAGVNFFYQDRCPTCGLGLWHSAVVSP